MEIINDLIKILLPATVSLLAIYYTVKAFLTKDFERKLVELKMANTNIVLPIRLQAYERMSLFLERISLHNLVVRLNDPSYNVAQFHQIIVHEIREEFSHNFSQQVYMSDKAWQEVKKAKDEIISIVNNAYAEIDKEKKGLDLAKRIFEILSEKDYNPADIALKAIKDEIRQVF